ncbi:sugar phosphate permease [Melghirimyces profundicolus]|uniref:Sugar phosphate permease n=1 Tax=Melghirimyces profundicolus TaxID=1242148 RepID=A0A2T6C9K0_9BACL|nr:MFS transporter [Melghirimyces profundicolus]PTX64999.1 sugar phosphate permease [Melghirimyces profundicolus]
MKNSWENPHRWGMLGLATAVQTGATLVTYGVGPLSAVWQQEFGWTRLQAGLLMSAVQLGPLLSMIWVGRMLDRDGERGWVGGGAVLLGLSVLTTMWGTGFSAFLLCLALTGLLYGTAQPGGSRAVARWFGDRERGLAMGIRQTGIPLGGALAGLALPFFSRVYGWEAGVGFQASVSILCGLAFLIFYREPSVCNPPKQSIPPLGESFRAVLGAPSLVPVLVSGIALVSLQMVLVTHWVSYVSERAGCSLEEGGRLLSLLLVSGAAGRVLLPWVSDRTDKGRQPFLLLCLAACGAGVWVIPFLSWQGGWIFLSLWIGFFGLGWYSLFLVQVAEAVEDQTVGFAVGFALTVNQIGIILAPVLFGWLADTSSYGVAWGAVGAGLTGAGFFQGRECFRSFSSSGGRKKEGRLL